MKCVICYLLIITCMILFCSCGLNIKSVHNPVTFYYKSPETKFGAQSSLVVGEIRESKGHTQDYQYLIEQYLNGPRTYDCISPFPAGTMLEELSVETTKAYITLTPHITTLSGSELMFACACLTKTVLEMTGVRSVQINSSNGTLNGMESITLTADSFVYWLEQ